MKYILLIIFITTSFAGLGQKTTVNLKTIQSVEDAEQYINSDSSHDASIVYLSSDQVTSVVERTLLKMKKGDTSTTGNYIYKVLSETNKSIFRVTYIYIDGSKFSFNQVDSIRNIILAKYGSGVSIEDLAKEYNMDGNLNNGDTGDFGEKMMVKEFEDAVKQHKKNDVFKVDIPSNNWFYVVKKTYDDKTTKKVTLLKVKSG